MKFVEFSNRLLIWHFHNKKKFGWRETKDPYKILISEILLHKTDSKKVEKLYPKFIEKFPTVYYLYQAESEEIDNLIKDIGLFYRGQRLKKIAEQIVNEFNGNISDNKEDLISLYGVGEYISNAVLCFAFKKRMPIVDTNVIRVYERVFNVKSLKSRPRTDKEMWDFAKKMLPKENYVEYNYALLDFASDICRAKKPLCEICPIKSMCVYRKEGVKNEWARAKFVISVGENPT
jgi:A/G-specific adenine glycosylase